MPGPGTVDFAVQTGIDPALLEEKTPEQIGFYGNSAAGWVGRITPSNLDATGKFAVRSLM